MSFYNASGVSSGYYSQQSVYPKAGVAAIKTSSVQRQPQPTPAANDSGNFSMPTRLYNYLGPFQAVTLFMAGMASSYALRLMLGGVMAGAMKTRVDKAGSNPANPIRELSKQADEVNDQTAVIFTEGLASVLMFALKNPGQVQNRLKGYLGASVLGYMLGSVADGAQEVWVRREETQIRADLLRQLSDNFQKSIRYKTAMDNQLREQAKARIVDLLNLCNIPQPEELLKPLPDLTREKMYRYPYEPVHFSSPLPPPMTYRFGENSNNRSDGLQIPNPGELSVLKALVFGAGMMCGLLGQAMLAFMKRSAQAPGVKHFAQDSKKAFYRIFNITNVEALFMTGNGHLLLTVLGLTALARVGKMLVDGYREIEVTRHNARTELRYQAYNWLSLDPRFHQIAEEEALEDSLRKLRDALPYEYNNRRALGNRIQTILTNIGRNSAPKYFQMTPPVNLVAARS